MQHTHFSKKHTGRAHPKRKTGFTVLEVLIALSILVVTLIATYQSFSTSLFVLQSTDNLWKSLVYTQNELLRWERSICVPRSVDQGEFNEKDLLTGFRWNRDIEDVLPVPGAPKLVVRRVRYKLIWNEGKNEFSYDSDLYVNAPPRC